MTYLNNCELDYRFINHFDSLDIHHFVSKWSMGESLLCNDYAYDNYEQNQINIKSKSKQLMSLSSKPAHEEENLRAISGSIRDQLGTDAVIVEGAF